MASTADRSPFLVPRVYVLVLEGGENVVKKLADFASLAKVQSGSVFICVGDVENVKLSNGAKTQKLKGPRMICSASGNVSMYGSRLVVSVVNSQGLSAIGELVSGTVMKGGSVEIGLLDVPPMAMKREQLKGGRSQLALDDPAITWVPVANSAIPGPPLYESAPNIDHVEKAREKLHYDPQKEVPGIGIWPSVFDLMRARYGHFSENAAKPANTENGSPAASLTGEERWKMRVDFSGEDGPKSSVRSIQLSPVKEQNGSTLSSEASEEEATSSAVTSEDDDSSEQSCNLEELCSAAHAAPFEAQPGTQEVHEAAGQRLEASLGFVAAPSQLAHPGRNSASVRDDVGLC